MLKIDDYRYNLLTIEEKYLDIWDKGLHAGMAKCEEHH